VLWFVGHLLMFWRNVLPPSLSFPLLWIQNFNSMLYYAATSHTLKVLQTQTCELGCKVTNIL